MKLGSIPKSINQVQFQLLFNFHVSKLFTNFIITIINNNELFCTLQKKHFHTIPNKFLTLAHPYQLLL